MKGLNKLALATAIAAVPFATQAMEPMSDAAMGNTTGQAGVTIELDTQLSIGQIAYSQGPNTGSFLVNNTSIQGIDDGNGDATSLDLAINIDLVEDGQTPADVAGSPKVLDSVAPAIAGLDPRGALNDGDALISIKNIANDSSEMVDLNLSIDDMGLADSTGTQQATLISGLNMDMYLSQLDIIAQVEDLNDATGGAGSLGVDVAFAIDSLDVNFDVAAVSLEGMRMAGIGSLDQLQAGDDVSAMTASGPAVTPAVVSMDIGQGGAVAADITEALNINLDNFTADIWMPTINVGNNNAGGSSIGSVGIRNLQVNDTTLAIYGRD